MRIKEVKKPSKKLRGEIETITDAMSDGFEQAEMILQDHNHDVTIYNLDLAEVADDGENWVVSYTVKVTIPKSKRSTS